MQWLSDIAMYVTFGNVVNFRIAHCRCPLYMKRIENFLLRELAPAYSTRNARSWTPPLRIPNCYISTWNEIRRLVVVWRRKALPLPVALQAYQTLVTKMRFVLRAQSRWDIRSTKLVSSRMVWLKWLNSGTNVERRCVPIELFLLDKYPDRSCYDGFAHGSNMVYGVLIWYST